MLVSGFPGRGYLSAASPILVALCTCDKVFDNTRVILSYYNFISQSQLFYYLTLVGITWGFSLKAFGAVASIPDFST